MDREDLNNIINWLDLISIYVLPQPNTAEDTFFSNVHRTFTKIGHILGYKTILSNCKSVFIQSVFSDHGGIKT